ncbi:putative kinetochore protein [Clavispora lusitaniae]|uniref:Kinetochore protein n=2 Tax=Clavispora lusitaniae TaxID=36911 RepID=C4XZQ4_CLAL4|nr:uncharacterized protein CLUG_01436 [Clavispora lusitaniae ATCC 42720]QFZ26321.1 putative kinetochore protein [Clavispora lusitaniae]EEQ37313.1 hypothetical protein CLUG_01436 [Clavispora lusitaniae ATCC 42720]QFZ31989.1 putative kinetochore protein [Clavispora lusitaniae]QFZ37658.1 putative kinetochore protein [Clavispora lusitaniae]QFZ43342.1 putative kinetochore protein [Clavispora lusitaniae]
MPPKKRATQDVNGSGGRKSTLPGIKHMPSRKRFEASDSDSDSAETNPVRSSQTILGTHNSLKQLLSAPAAATPKKVPKKRGRKPKRQQNAPDSPMNTASTPISRLEQATALLDSPNSAKRSSIKFDDIDEQPAPKKRGRGRPRKNPLPVDTPQILPRRKVSKAPRQIKKAPSRVTASVFADDSDSFVEQVSHHTLDLADGPSDGPAKRRTSYNNRGKRVSSVGNGYEGKPHSEVPESEYYKMLDSDMPEPSRMRQLLVWCFRKKLESDNDGEGGSDGVSDTARGISKIIKQELLDDLVDGAISTSWYSRGQQSDTEVSGKRIIRPNPLNESNKESMEIFTRKLRQLEGEQDTWRHAFERSVEPLKNLVVRSDGEDRETLAEYLDKPGTREMVTEVLRNQLIQRLENNRAAAQASVKDELQPAVDGLYHLSHRMKSGVELVGRVERERLSSQVAHMVRRYMDRARGRGVTPLSSRDLLRGISRMDAPER